MPKQSINILNDEEIYDVDNINKSQYINNFKEINNLPETDHYI